MNTVVISAKIRAEARRARRRIWGDLTAKHRILKALAAAESLSSHQINQQTGVRPEIIDMTLSRLRADESVIRVNAVRRGVRHQITAKGRAILRGQSLFDSRPVIEQARALPNSVFALGDVL
jgi:hypothetical protein